MQKPIRLCVKAAVNTELDTGNTMRHNAVSEESECVCVCSGSHNTAVRSLTFRALRTADIRL